MDKDIFNEVLKRSPYNDNMVTVRDANIAQEILVAFEDFVYSHIFNECGQIVIQTRLEWDIVKERFRHDVCRWGELTNCSMKFVDFVVAKTSLESLIGKYPNLWKKFRGNCEKKQILSQLNLLFSGGTAVKIGDKKNR